MSSTLEAGIQFATNLEGKKVAVLLDLKKHGELWENIPRGSDGERDGH